MPHDRARRLQLRSERSVIDDIRSSSEVEDATAFCRKVLAEHGRHEVAPPEMQRVRKGGTRESLTYYEVTRSAGLTAALFGVAAPAGTPRRDLNKHATGLYVFDVDVDVSDVDRLKSDCLAWAYTRIAATSVSGEALWLVVSGLVPKGRREYTTHLEAILAVMPDSMRRHVAPHQANLDRLRYLASDPTVHYNPSAPAVTVKVQDLDHGGAGVPGTNEGPLAKPEGWPAGTIAARKKTRRILSRVALPDGSYPLWVDAAFSLVDGDRIYGPEFDGRSIFVEWTENAAYPGSTKPGRALDQYERVVDADWTRGVGPRRTLASLGKGDGKNGSYTQRRQAEMEVVIGGVNSWIGDWVRSENLVHWRGRFRVKRGSLWLTESDAVFRQDLQKALAKAQGDTSKRRVGTETRASALESLKDAVVPPATSELLLHPINHLKNYNLQTGRLLQSTAFTNGTVTLDPAAPDGFALGSPDHWDFFTTYRPYAIPAERPPDPEHFNTFLAFRWPDPTTRLAIKQVIGASLLQRLAREQHFVFLKGPGGSGKGTLTRILSELIGFPFICTVPNLARLASSQFATSPLEGAALLLVADATDTAKRRNHDAIGDGLTFLRNLTGGG